MLRYLFLAAAILGLVATLTARHINWWWAAEHATKVLISITYLLPPHRIH